MKMNLYAIFDTASGVFDRPWCAMADGEATDRDWETLS